MGNSFSNAPWRLGHSEKNYQAAEEKSCRGEIELENEVSNEDWRCK